MGSISSEKIERGESLITSYPYPVQVWSVGSQLIVSLGGEVVIDYAIRLKQIFGQNIFILGYCNDRMSYIPSGRVLREGGYESISSQRNHGFPSTWKSEIETMIIKKVLELANKVDVTQVEL